MEGKHIIIKRDNRKDIFSSRKLYEKINRARLDANESFEGVEQKLLSVVKCIEQTLPEEMEVEKLHQVVEQTLYNEGLFGTARAYTEYRQNRDHNREMKSNLMKTVSAIGIETDRDNANVGGNFSAKMLRIASETNKVRNLGSMPKRFARAHEVGDFYIHDLDSYNLTINCIAGTEFGLFRDSKSIQWCRFSELNKYFGIDEDITYNPGIYTIGRKGWTKVNAISRRKLHNNEPLYHIITQTSSDIKVTGEHKIPVIRDSKEVLLLARDIKIGDELICRQNIYNIVAGEISIGSKLPFRQNKSTLIEGTPDSKVDIPLSADIPEVNTKTEKVVGIQLINNYDGYVYDLETAEHWFIVNNYVVHNCLHIPLGKALAESFNTGYGTLNTPQRIETAAELSCILLQSTQNDMFGGQSHPNFANDLAPYLQKTEQEIAQQVLDGKL